MKLSAIAAALALSLPMAAQADATATAQIGNFRYEVIDLDLNDGVTAALTLEDTGFVLMAGFQQNGIPDPLDYLTEEGSVATNVAHGSSTVSFAGGVANASANHVGTQGQLFGTFGWDSSFTLTANTKLVVYADASVAGTIDDERYGSSNAAVFADYWTTEEVELRDYMISYLGSSDARTLSITFSSGAEAINGEIGYTASAYANVSAVPEPSQVALLTLGLAGLGWRLRRNGQRK
ncbi:PEP-CTERM sorting domain-containing protein [Massilia sp. METH4]|uniref:PEP-CTERM sorting domain-containing protein n=1 Tax=Massilia sp. METH4 TaxID=3123041 RepID=UPI0030CBEC81